MILDYDPAVVHFSSCQGTPAIGSKNAVSVGTQLPGRLTVVLTGDVITIPDGDIIACTFAIDVDAAPWASPLTFISADLADDHFDDFFATGTNGSVTVLP